MAQDIRDAEMLDVHPYDADATTYVLDLTTASASITLPAGGYTLTLAVNSGTGFAFCRVGAAAVIPASGASGAGFTLPPGAIATYATTGAVLHAIMSAGTATLHAVRVR